MTANRELHLIGLRKYGLFVVADDNTTARADQAVTGSGIGSNSYFACSFQNEWPGQAGKIFRRCLKQNTSTFYSLHFMERAQMFSYFLYAFSLEGA